TPTPARADIVVRGYGGYNSRWALFLIQRIFPLVGLPPVATTIFFGANDAALPGRTSQRQHVPVEEYRQNLKTIVNHLKDCSKSMVILLITPPPIDEDGRERYARSQYGEDARRLPERTNEMAGVYAGQCIELAKEMDVQCVDLWSKMQATEGWQKLYLSDGLHLTPEGNALVHKEVVQTLRGAGLKAEDMPHDFPHHSKIDGVHPERAFQ
uniref:SGNH hydrolase-type esterase domain-containing protein n=1 Tax=Aegilops tauschii subsp. strangulata TaxID=200361 RepID=A0A453QFL6_AEGTS